MKMKVTLEIEGNKLTLSATTDEEPKIVDGQAHYRNLDRRCVELVEVAHLLYGEYDNSEIEETSMFTKSIKDEIKRFKEAVSRDRFIDGISR